MEEQCATARFNIQLDFPFSPPAPIFGSSPLTKDVLASSVPTRSQASHTDQIIRDPLFGQRLPESFVAALRRQVDPTFSNPNWGDEHYFADSNYFRDITDLEQSPHQESDDRAILEGLKMQARMIPMRKTLHSGRCMKESVGSQRNQNGEQDAKRSLLPPAEEMERRGREQIRATTFNSQYSHIPHASTVFPITQTRNPVFHSSSGSRIPTQQKITIMDGRDTSKLSALIRPIRNPTTNSKGTKPTKEKNHIVATNARANKPRSASASADRGHQHLANRHTQIKQQQQQQSRTRRLPSPNGDPYPRRRASAPPRLGAKRRITG